MPVCSLPRVPRRVLSGAAGNWMDCAGSLLVVLIISTATPIRLRYSMSIKSVRGGVGVAPRRNRGGIIQQE